MKRFCALKSKKQWPSNRTASLWLAMALPVILPGGHNAFGAEKTIPFQKAKAIDGRRLELKLQDGQFLTVIFYSTQCPIANATAEELALMAKTMNPEKVRFLGVCVDPDITTAEVLTHAKEYQLNFDLVHDQSGTLTRKFGASVTPEAFVIDSIGHVRYQGRINDKFVDRPRKNPNPEKNDLKLALDALTQGKNPAVSQTKAIGCPVPETTTSAKQKEVTYAREISRIIQKKCQECHSKGNVGPFPLENYEHARKRAYDLAAVTSDRLMPPWKAERGYGRAFKNDHSLSDEEIQAFDDWAEAGAPLGDIAEMPAPITFPTGWKLGTPDLVLQLPEGFEIPANGPDLYRCFVLPTNLPSDVYISKIEYLPDNKLVSHHILAWTDISGAGRREDEKEPGPGYISFVGPGIKTHSSLGGWAAGKSPTILPDGIGVSLPANADLIVQMHYHPSGKPERDRSRIGLHFSRKPIRATYHLAAAANKSFSIPAGANNHEVSGELIMPTDVIAYGVSPHQHLIGRDIRMSVVFPDGREEKLIRIPRWDFNWQTSYEFEKPLELPKGTVLKVVGTYDNSAENPFNPNKPPLEMKWGPATTDEMLNGFINLVKKGQDLTRPGEKDDLNQLLLDANTIREQKALESLSKKP
jgi:peroxiredoxin